MGVLLFPYEVCCFGFDSLVDDPLKLVRSISQGYIRPRRSSLINLLDLDRAQTRLRTLDSILQMGCWHGVVECT